MIGSEVLPEDLLGDSGRVDPLLCSEDPGGTLDVESPNFARLDSDPEREVEELLLLVVLVLVRDVDAVLLAV